MFATKPATPSLEFEELSGAFDRATLALLFDRDPDTVGRWRQAQRVPHTVEMTVDRFWWVMHVACTECSWPLDRTRYFLLSIELGLGRRPADLVRESDEQARAVVELIASSPRPVTPPRTSGPPSRQRRPRVHSQRCWRPGPTTTRSRTCIACRRRRAAHAQSAACRSRPIR